jgi:hypothetical protein
MFSNIPAEDYERMEHAAREAKMSIEDFMREVIEARMRELTEGLARERGITVEQLEEELDQEPPDEDQEREDAILESLDWKGN